MRKSLRRIAIHEAGHAVARERLGLYHGWISIKPNVEKGILGSSAGGGCLEEDDITLSFAGYISEVVAGFKVVPARMLTSSDFEDAIEKFNLSPSAVEEWKSRTIDLMSKPENVRAVSVLADYLVQYKTLRYEEVETLIHASDEDPENVQSCFERTRLILDTNT